MPDMSSAQPEPMAEVVPFPSVTSRAELFPADADQRSSDSSRRAASLPLVEQFGRTAFGLATLMGEVAGHVARRTGEAVVHVGGEVVTGAVSGVVSRIDLEPIVDQVVDRIDFDPIISKVIDNLDMGDIINDVMGEVRMSNIVMDATGGITSDLVGDVREKGLEADDLVERLVGKVLHRRG